ncbi:hypothetical protein MARBORIA2_14760 [Methanobrevibacter arboriphilus]|jgi:hypothetical protein|uniref:Uncharacterized protein n=1 Tax=Methanobrevibacter arboriphilus TaxID=39441 RepID=A0ACA8R322_METAZ|nr:hypothetical protein [Methanobrevibacter arboriphilus]BBL61522.1 hypothetical protein MarbSA_05620 [Methanobrevibacter arboriphilus]GLI12386.1 hypothetical protein MARBORIA2_14760 [Methanobrevibacter arboriphilus]
MKFKEISLAKTIMLAGLIIAILYGMYLGQENISLAALGIIGGYLAKDIELKNSEGEDET